MSTAITIGIVAAITAGLAQAVAHQIAARYDWPRVPRYVAGITIIAVAFAPVMFSALSVEQAAVLYGLFWLIVGASGLSTWICYEADKRPKAGPPLSRDDLEKWADAIAGEHGDEP